MIRQVVVLAVVVGSVTLMSAQAPAAQESAQGSRSMRLT
jgi:hypothetical protein